MTHPRSPRTKAPAPIFGRGLPRHGLSSSSIAETIARFAAWAPLPMARCTAEDHDWSLSEPSPDQQVPPPQTSKEPASKMLLAARRRRGDRRRPRAPVSTARGVAHHPHPATAEVTTPSGAPGRTPFRVYGSRHGVRAGTSVTAVARCVRRCKKPMLEPIRDEPDARSFPGFASAPPLWSSSSSVSSRYRRRPWSPATPADPDNRTVRQGLDSALQPGLCRSSPYDRPMMWCRRLPDQGRATGAGGSARHRP